MPRPKKCRSINCKPASEFFKPRGIPMFELEEVVLEPDELEAIRLADLLGHSQESASARMGVSRPTFSRIIEKARRKVADCLLNGKAINLTAVKPILAENKMKIAVATNDNVRVTGHLGRCRKFIVYTVNDGKITGRETRDNTFTHHHQHGHDHSHGEGHQHGHGHSALIEGLKDCKYVIFQSGGWRVVEDLKANAIQPILTDEPMADDAVTKFLKGTLEERAGNVCRAH